MRWSVETCLALKRLDCFTCVSSTSPIQSVAVIQQNNRVGQVTLIVCDFFWPEVEFASALIDQLFLVSSMF